MKLTSRSVLIDFRMTVRSMSCWNQERLKLQALGSLFGEVYSYEILVSYLEYVELLSIGEITK